MDAMDQMNTAFI